MAEERIRRRLAAILAADVVGYSRLIRADEEGTLARLRSLRKEVIDPNITRYTEPSLSESAVRKSDGASLLQLTLNK